jgi:putative DNA primase/helicase
MTDAVTAKPTGAISRTYLGPDGRKVGKAKTLGSPAGIVRLSPDEDVEGGLHLCEGLETGLCAMSLGFRPLWATGSTSLMRVFPVLGGVECLTTLADRDGNGAGEEAATESARRWRAAGREAPVKRLNQGLGDINDAVRRSR